MGKGKERGRGRRLGVRERKREVEGEEGRRKGGKQMDKTSVAESRRHLKIVDDLF